MSSGRIEVYLHSDSTTTNKGGALVKIRTQTDFCSRTEGFIEFAKKAARYAFAASAMTWLDVVEAFPDIEEERLTLEKEMCEIISVTEIAILKI